MRLSRSSRLALALRAVVAAPVVLSPAIARAEPQPTFGLSFAIARSLVRGEREVRGGSEDAPPSRDDAGGRVVGDAWINGQLEDANHLFNPLGTWFRWTKEKDLAEPHGELHSRRDRDALTPLMEGGVIDVFVVRELEDVDEPGRYRMGVCWTGRGGKRFIVLSQSARATVLAHELGHFFGNHQHSTVTNNIMSYQRDGALVFFDERQIATIKSFTTSFLETRRLIDVGPPWRMFF